MCLATAPSTLPCLRAHVWLYVGACTAHSKGKGYSRLRLLPVATQRNPATVQGSTGVRPMRGFNSASACGVPHLKETHLLAA